MPNSVETTVPVEENFACAEQVGYSSRLPISDVTCTSRANRRRELAA